jgi:hypothetical protein
MPIRPGFFDIDVNSIPLRALLAISLIHPSPLFPVSRPFRSYADCRSSRSPESSDFAEMIASLSWFQDLSLKFFQ